ncbi:MAG: 1-acyl-sn-glycerol-3-phosphate acyltransferase [Bacteroidales bacterium]
MMEHIRWKNLERESIRYALLKIGVKLWHNLFYYRKVTALNTHKIPENRPLIFAPNHENAAMDGLAVLCTTRGQPVFLARSDIFKKKLPALLLTFLKIMPIYRIRDGISSLQKNDRVFQKTVEILKRKRPLVILPEGNHAEFKRLRPLKKGITRIAFQAEEASGYNLGINIVPVGIDYRDIYKFNTDVLVNYGDPIDVSEYFDLYRENAQKGMLALREHLASAIRKLMVHIPTEKYYHGYMGLLDLYFHRMKTRMQLSGNTHANKFQSDRKLVEILNRFLEKDPETVAELSCKAEKFFALMKKLRLRNWLFEKDRISFTGIFLHGLLLVIGFPVFLTGLLTNYIPWHIPVKVTEQFEDKVFISTVKFVVSFLLFPLYYLLLFILFWIISGNLLIALGGFTLCAFTGWIGFKYFISWKKWLGKYRYRRFMRKKNKTFNEAKNLRNELISRMDELVASVFPMPESS